MKNERRSPASLLLSLAIHAVVGLVLVNVAFHYDFSSLYAPRTPAPVVEHLTYVTVGPAAGATGGSTGGAPAKAAAPPRALVAPVRVPSVIAPAPAKATGTEGGAVDGKGVGGGTGDATGIVPGEPDPRLSADAHQFVPAPKTHRERVDSAVHALIYAYNDSVARAAAAAGKKPGDWTFEKNGQKYGIDQQKIYLGKLALPTALLALLPLNVQGNPARYQNDRMKESQRQEIYLNAQRAMDNDEFKDAVKHIRERKDREHKAELAAKHAQQAAEQQAQDAQSNGNDQPAPPAPPPPPPPSQEPAQIP